MWLSYLCIAGFAVLGACTGYFNKGFHALGISFEGAPPGEKWFSQRLNHFGMNQFDSYWNQRYFYHDYRHSNQVDSPIFIYVGGEGPLRGLEVEGGLVAKLAQEFGAEAYALEHRYYGESRPTQTTQTNDLEWLSMRQAIADLVAFAERVKGETSSKVVLFGCSYPGVIAAVARSMHSSSFVGAISGSAPVRAIENFAGFDEKVRSVLSQNDAECPKNLGNQLKMLENQVFSLLESNSTSLLKELVDGFGCTSITIEDDFDAIAFLYGIADLFVPAVQYNRKSLETGKSSVETACSTLSMGENGLQKAILEVQSSFNQTCDTEAWRAQRDVDWNGSQDVVNSKMWLYQCCSEFGFWQVGSGHSLRSPLITVDWMLNLCDRVFPRNQWSTNVARETNQWTGGRKIAALGAATNIHFTNGENDPWSLLSVTNLSETSSKRESSSHIIRGGSHCMEFCRELENEPEVVEAQSLIHNAVAAWLFTALEHVIQQ